ncbi:hypothetical protein OS175_09080 [Marinicella sp. S1101]|uniref:hypothetical protein n=1 Tax=Marinicella marina TaxID=2996016 RepID=UPI002260F999|nr:hypothetical protein [Marinicella marina]MCX7554029.1 hypothetical protein [Marinicella marina]MDJ1140521.1 hypothetical protein [Marinicella marina]
MRTTILIMSLLSGAALAQNSTQQNNDQAVEDKPPVTEQKKRPSWSQGLPERQNAPSAGSLLSKPKAVIDDTPEQQAIRPELEVPEIDLGFKPKPASEFNVEPVSVDLSLSREEMRETFYESEKNEPEVEVVDSALLAQYKWQVIKVTEVEVPSDFDASKALNLNIHINPKGEVVKVVSEDSGVSSRAMRVIEKSIKNWRFEPPADLGIAANINKSFNIDIQAD